MTIRPNIEDIIRHKDSFLLFYKYLKQSHAEEALNFWVEAELYQSVTRQSDLHRRAKEIFNKYLKTGSHHEVNVDGGLTTQLAETIANADKQAAWGDAHKNLFVPIQAAALNLLSNSSLSSFLASKEYKKYTCGSLRAASKSNYLPGKQLVKIAKRSRSQTMEVFDKYFDLLDDKPKQALKKLDVSISSAGYNSALPCIHEVDSDSSLSVKFPSKPLPPKPLSSKPLPPVPETKSRSQLALAAENKTTTVEEETTLSGHQHEYNKNGTDLPEPSDKTKPLSLKIKYVRPRSLSILLASQTDSKKMEDTTIPRSARQLKYYTLKSCSKQRPKTEKNVEGTSSFSCSGEEEDAVKVLADLDIDSYCGCGEGEGKGEGDGVSVLEALDIDSMAAALCT